ncbi:peptide-N(4)-(N-acetyl-beta-glucosaminyl)asparagine amidase [Fopius arisanus]|uniref:Peptide-N(4)-(N-acetyl-beta-glucosaminyl)asparagine amidase n=1 Tax=Fopius arisanus TaxID=64838 RepID=A0A9R1U813_9HYME|nr:PREDICTED: peptide-N(4)-(N-acetyl-beta-glucosaminyl)asparagine amidase-like [Fopius arisanus]
MDSSLRNCLKLLHENDSEIKKNALHVLWELCENIIKNPQEPRYRRIRVANPVIAEKLLPANGAVECLFEIGFQEDGEFFSLPTDSPLPRIREIQRLLREIQTQKPISSPQPAAPAVKSTGARPKDPPVPNFLQQIENMFDSVLEYEDQDLQEMTRHMVPITDLKLRAMKRMRALQRDLKQREETEGETEKEKTGIENDMGIEDLLLGELMAWFKNDFFTWFTTIKCSSCSTNCKYNRTEFQRRSNVSRIEIYKCESCETEEEFPRYTNPRMVLANRKGRCGEWATCFTLICRAFSYDARLVHDKTDHVWTEVWSVAGNRWIHADPCENTLDRPLLYEKGWKKKLSYIIAYSRDEIQDVTWRYTRDQPSVMKRRNLCTEEDLAEFLWRLNEKRQSNPGYSQVRKKYVVNRRLMELAEFLRLPGQPDNDDNEYGGRISGDAAWRSARGEISDENKSHIWKIPEGINSYLLRLYLVKDYYEIQDEEGKLFEKLEGWREGTAKAKGLFRNVENDWQMVYVCRSPGVDLGSITWSFEICDKSEEFQIECFKISSTTALFHGASIKWKIQGITQQNKTITITLDNSKPMSTSALKDAKRINIIADLSGGSGDAYWQHAQLFRHSLDDIDECSLSISFELSQN